MPSIDEIIKREINPFDPITFKPGNFWQVQQDSALTVNSIHQEAIADIEAQLHLIAKDHSSRTVILAGDSGSGKSYLLGRLKRTLNSKAFFAYIGPWPDSDYMWRHILRYTVDSLMHVPEGQQDSQLMLWLKSLAAVKQLTMKELLFNESVWNLLRSDRQKFVKNLKDTYKQAGIYNADIFFGMLHNLTNPELYPLACEWLRGDDLSEDSLQALKVRGSIDSEDVAKNILANFGKISAETQPIVLCFDNLDNIPRVPDGFIDIQALFNVNTAIHNDHLKNFLIIISIVTNTLKQNLNRIQPSDKVGIHKIIQLKRINLEQAEAIWDFRLQPLHVQADSQPSSKIYPLTRQALEKKFPGSKTDPRNVLQLGHDEYQRYKRGGDVKPNVPAEFQLIWQHEFNKVQERITKITLLATPELIRMLQQALAALKVQGIKPKLLTGKFANYSLSYQNRGQQERIGIVWTEDPNMTSFVNVMKACQKVVNHNLCQNLYLIRTTGVGHTKLAGNQIYRQIFTGSPHRHIQPSLSSVHYLATYQSLVNAAEANELVIAGKTRSLQELETLIRESNVLNDCRLFQDLVIIPSTSIEIDISNKVKECLLNMVKKEGFLGRKTLIQQVHSQFSSVHESEFEDLIQKLVQDNKIKVLNPTSKPEAQLICLLVA